MYRTINPQKAFEVCLRLFFGNLLWILWILKTLVSCGIFFYMAVIPLVAIETRFSVAQSPGEAALR